MKHLEHCTFYTDNWEAFAEVLPSDRHVCGKEHTAAIERDNSNTRHHIARFTRKTKVVSQKEEMVHATLKLWHAMTTDDRIFKECQKTALSIYR